MWNCLKGSNMLSCWRGLSMVIDSANVPYVFMLIVQDMLGLGRWWIISFYVSDVLLEAGLQIQKN